MGNKLFIYNTLSRKKEPFHPENPPFVGIYVCGPTVYSDVHLGNCRTFISFDLVYRYLLHLGYQVRYVRNITDAGHLEGDRDEGDDKFAKKAKLEQLEPMEIVQKYTLGFHDVMRIFNTLPPNIEPTATGHISEQIEMIKQIIAHGFAYEVNGSIYFDVEAYSKIADYAILTNRQLEDLLVNTRELGGQNEKKGRLDFALWIQAKPEHMMRWPSPWSVGFPGWHIECSAMSHKYLGDRFDIHGGGIDLAATHHTNEIAQAEACHHQQPAKYWMHSNMLTVHGARMSKSTGNSFLPAALFKGNHPLLKQEYPPMAVRFFMLQAHYRSTLDLSDEALSASKKGYQRFMNAIALLDKIIPSEQSNFGIDIAVLRARCYAAMNDDFNSPILIAELFELVPIINSLYDGKMQISAADLPKIKALIRDFVFDILGLKGNENESKDIKKIVNWIIELRSEAKANQNYILSDKIRIGLQALGIEIKDQQDKTTWKKIV